MTSAPLRWIPTGLALLVAVAVPGCRDRDPDTIESPSDSERRPFRDQWRVEADVEFVHTAPDGTVLIADLSIGGSVEGENFANRGDVIVRFDGPADRMLVEMRRFTNTRTEDLAELDYERLSLWAYDAPLGRPQEQDEQDDCVATGWRSGCALRVYWDGLNQISRGGADLRITLPADYRRGLSIVTEDDIEDDDYHNRADVCVSGLPGSASITADSGRVWVSLARDITPTPTCSAEEIARCEDWTTDDGTGVDAPAPWDPACGCVEHGSLDIISRSNQASDITVDVPAGLWASIRAKNTGSNSTDGQFCEVEAELLGLELDSTGNDFPWQLSGAASYPGDPAVGGAGYFVRLESSECRPVAHTDAPEDFVGLGNGDQQESELRGAIEICDGCIVADCDDLVP